MSSIESVREVINRHFQHVKDLGDGIVRGERRHNGKPYAVAYIDLSDEVVERSRDLKRFQEGLIGADFFSSDNDLRWNSYLFFWAGPHSTASEAFPSAKAQIESDRHFARKFVLDEETLAKRLGEKTAEAPQAAKSEMDAGGTWAELLRADSLAVLLEQRPRTVMVELIESGEAFKVEVARPAATAAVKRDALARGLLRQLKIGHFRHVHKERAFDFGDVNLIIGPNGAGKTSLLEAIEVLYCGRVRRDPDAGFSDVTGTVESADGARVTVKATTTTATLKARNMAWYGRTDVQASAISQGFTRFNFLDTDAAFRLSSDQSKDQIQADLAKLLVGPDTSRLWTYLSNLNDELCKRLRGVVDQIPGTKLNVELLEEEVTRLKNTPSQFSTLVKTFRSSVAQLNPKWTSAADAASLSPDERLPISAVLGATQRVLASAAESPVTKSSLDARLSRAQQASDSAQEIEAAYELALKEASASAVQTEARARSHLSLEQWGRLINAGVPALAERLETAEARVVALRRVLRAHPSEGLPSIPPEYATAPLSGGLPLARQRLEQAQEQERTSTHALAQAEQFGQTLGALRRDLHAVSTAYIERSGEREICPLCKTAHGEGELHAKLQALIATSDSSMSDSLRHGVQLARERVEECRRALHVLTAMDAYRVASDGSPDATPVELQADAKRRQEELEAAATMAEAARNERKSLELLGLEFGAWTQVRDAARSSLLPSIDINDASRVSTVLAHLKEQVEAGRALQVENALAMQAQSDKARQLAAEVGMPPSEDMLPTKVRAFIERKLMEAQVASAAMEEIEAAVILAPNASVETIQTALQACLLDFDKAAQASELEAGAGSLMKTKEGELQTATSRLSKTLAARENLSRATKLLANIVENHSLDKATADSFSAIRGKVSDVFAQIHSPPEYTLGNFSDGQLIIRRDDARQHDVNQVSTGQRAALALSIFLALNESATTAPPVILIDDPVAHIDDLNALSFLDYLRDVVVGSRKQVFFATADARLAALFQRKFEFLGDQRFKRIHLAPK